MFTGGNNHKEVAILLATYNGEPYIRNFLDSLIKQEYANFKLYISDDGSSDATMNILRSYESILEIEFLKSSAHLGAAKNFFKLLEEVDDRHSYYMFADQDDYWYSDKIFNAVDILKNISADKIVYFSRLEYVDSNLKTIGYSKIPNIINLQNAIVENIINGCTLVITNNMRAEVLKYKPIDYVMHDWWFYLCGTTFGKIIYDPRFTIKYRQHGKSTIGIKSYNLKYLKISIYRFFQNKAGINNFSKQSISFLNCYNTILNTEQRTLLEKVKDASINKKFKYIYKIFFKLKRQNNFDNIFLHLIILLKKF